MKAIPVILAAVAVCATWEAAAQETGFYVGAALGQTKFTEWCEPSPAVLACDDTDTAWKLLGGYRFNRNIAVEATYVDWGTASGTVQTGSGPRGVSASQTRTGIAAVGSLDLTPRFTVFGKAGFLMTEQETPASSVRERDETEFHYGLGVRFSVGPAWSLRGEWERTEKLKAQLLSIGLEFRFR